MSAGFLGRVGIHVDSGDLTQEMIDQAIKSLEDPDLINLRRPISKHEKEFNSKITKMMLSLTIEQRRELLEEVFYGLF